MFRGIDEQTLCGAVGHIPGTQSQVNQGKSPSQGINARNQWERLDGLFNAGFRAISVGQCFAVCSSLDKTSCISESAAASPFARSAVI